MKRIRRSGNFFVSLLINTILNFEQSIPAWILLALHFILGWSIWWFWLAFGIWILGIIIRMKLYSWAFRCGNVPDVYKENKNPYSAKNDDFIQNKRNKR